MKKDPTEFRQRFALWKNGEKPYENGLPKYEDGTPETITDYPILFIKDKAVKLTNAGLATGAVLSTNLLDSIADNADRAGLDLQTALGLATKESTLGNPTDDRSMRTLLNSKKQKELIDHLQEVYGLSYNLLFGLHINRGDIVRGQELINWYKDEDNIEHKPSPPLYTTHPDRKSVIQKAFEFYKQHPDKYNPGQKNYQRLVDKRGAEVILSPEVLKWLKERNIKKATGRFNRLNPLLNESKFNLPRYKNGKCSLPKYSIGTDGELDMGNKMQLTPIQTAKIAKSTIHEQPVSNADPIGQFVIESVGATKGAKILGDILAAKRIDRMKEVYKRIRSFDNDIQNYTGKSLRRENIKMADKAARESFTLSRPDNPLYWIFDPIVSGYTKIQSHPVLGPLIPF